MKKLTPKQRVLKKYPEAFCIQASGCSFAVFERPLEGRNLLALAHSERAAWAAAARKIGK